MTNWFAKPFSVEDADGKTWAVATDKASFIAIQGQTKLPRCTGPEDGVAEILRMIALEPKGRKTLAVEPLRAFLEGKKLVQVVGVPVDAERLVRLIEKARKPEVDFWDASSEFRGKPCLGLVVGPKWKAFLMGFVDTVDGDVEVYTPAEGADRSLFDEVMDLPG